MCVKRVRNSANKYFITTWMSDKKEQEIGCTHYEQGQFDKAQEWKNC